MLTQIAPVRTLPVLIALLTLLLCGAANVFAWDRGEVTTFAVLPAGSSGPEGLTVGPDGNVYVATFGFNGSGPVPGPGQLFTFSPEGHLVSQVSVANASPNLLGLAFPPGSTSSLLVLDCSLSSGFVPQVWSVDPTSGSSSTFMTIPGAAAGQNCPNGVTFDKNGNVYVSDSFAGKIWRTGPTGGTATVWASDATLLTPAPVVGVPPFGANGVEFNNAGTAMFVANTANDSLIKIVVNSDGSAGAITTFTNSINGADGIAIDSHDNIWAAANQEDEIVVVDPTGKAIAKLGDFDGLDKRGTPRGLLFPASPAFSKDGRFLYVTNLSLNLTLFGHTAIDSAWCAQVQRYTVSRIQARIPPLPSSEKR